MGIFWRIDVGISFIVGAPVGHLKFWSIDIGISFINEVRGDIRKFWYYDVGIDLNVEVPGGNLKFLYVEHITFHTNQPNHTPPVRTRGLQRGCMADAQVEGEQPPSREATTGRTLYAFLQLPPVGLGLGRGQRI